MPHNANPPSKAGTELPVTLAQPSQQGLHQNSGTVHHPQSSTMISSGKTQLRSCPGAGWQSPPSASAPCPCTVPIMPPFNVELSQSKGRLVGGRTLLAWLHTVLPTPPPAQIGGWVAGGSDVALAPVIPWTALPTRPAIADFGILLAQCLCRKCYVSGANHPSHPPSPSTDTLFFPR